MAHKKATPNDIFDDKKLDYLSKEVYIGGLQ
jgi:hypothetical protein